MSSAPNPAAGARCNRSRAGRWHLLVLLALILAVVRVDRIALGLSLEGIKVDLQISDMQIGMLTGVAFALFYAVFGIPIARLADRGNRVAIIALASAFWGAAVCLCGTATSFVQLLLMRVAVAVGETGCYPASLSLISDHYDRDERPRAVARYMLGLPLALAVGGFAAGWSIELYGWNTTFILIGLPGLLLAALAAFTLKEPRRTSSFLEKPATSLPDEASSKEVVRFLWRCVAYRHLLLCFSIWGFFGYGILQWQPVFFMRSHGMESGELGIFLALIYGVGGLLGTYVGGELASLLAPNNERLQLLAIAAVYMVLAVLTAGVYVVSNLRVAFTLLALSALSGAASNGPLFASIQTLVPTSMRATATAFMYLLCNLIGMGLGPLAVGALSDQLQPVFGEESLRYALLALCPGYLWCAWHLWRASRTMDRDMARRQAGHVAPAA